jgi:hypothetical protein
MTIDEKVDILVKRYKDSQRTDLYEPLYKIMPYDIICSFAENRQGDKVKGLTKGQYEALQKCYGEEYNHKQLLEIFESEALDSMLTKDATVIKGGGIFPDRVSHDGYKVGTTSWVFMGRKDSPIAPINYYGKTLYAIKRVIPHNISSMLKPLHPEVENIVWCAYDLDGKYGVEIGPCISLDHIHQVANGDGHITIRTFI